MALCRRRTEMANKKRHTPRGGGGQATAGGRAGVAGAGGGRRDPCDRGDGGDLLSLAQGVRRPEVGPGEAAEGAGSGERPAAQGGGGSSNLRVYSGRDQTRREQI